MIHCGKGRPKDYSDLGSSVEAVMQMEISGTLSWSFARRAKKAVKMLLPAARGMASNPLDPFVLCKPAVSRPEVNQSAAE